MSGHSMEVKYIENGKESLEADFKVVPLDSEPEEV